MIRPLPPVISGISLTRLWFFSSSVSIFLSVYKKSFDGPGFFSFSLPFPRSSGWVSQNQPDGRTTHHHKTKLCPGGNSGFLAARRDVTGPLGNPDRGATPMWPSGRGRTTDDSAGFCLLDLGQAYHFFCILLGASSCRMPRKRELGRIHYVGVSGRLLRKTGKRRERGP
jgi:hypothetical protein